MSKYFIYKLTSPNGKCYIGRTNNIKRRFGEYRNLKCKEQPKIFRALVKYRPDSFNYEIVEETSKEFCRERETFWIRKLDSVKNGYNCTDVDMGEGFMNDHTKSKISKSLTGTKRSEEFRKIQRNREKSQEFLFYVGNSDNFKSDCIKELNRKRMTEENPMKNKIFTESERKEKSTIARKIAENNFYEFEKEGTKYITNRLSDFIEEHFLHKRSVFRVIKGERLHHKGWRIRKLEQ